MEGMPIKKIRINRLDLEFLKGMLKDFPGIWRVVVAAFYCDKMKIKDIAAALECSPNIIRYCLHLTRKIFKVKLLENAFKELFATKEYRMSPARVNPTYAAVCGVVGLVPSTVIPTEHENNTKI